MRCACLCLPGREPVRVFSRQEIPHLDLVALVESDEDDEDRARARILRNLLQWPTCALWAYPGTLVPPELHVYVATPLSKLANVFACVVVNPDGVTAMLQSSPVVVEGATLQVVDTPGAALWPTNRVINAALERWAVRNRVVKVEAWRDLPVTVRTGTPGADE